MTTMSSKLFQGHCASSSSIEADYLSLSVDSVHDLAQLVSKELQLNERQCQDLSSKLVQTVENIQKLVPPSGPLKVPFGPALKNLYRVLEKAKLLVHQCCAADWCRAAVFQIHNEGAFGELLQEVGLCYNVVYEVTKGITRDWVWTLIQALDLRQSSLFLPAPETDVQEDQETLKRRLQQVADTADDRKSYLARYLLKKLECISEADMNEDSNAMDALLWMKEIDPHETWKWQGVIGSGSGAACVCCYEWLGIPCARKEFHFRVDDDVFRREVAILAQLNHPNIVKFFCYSNGPKVGECFIAMELMEKSLGSLIERPREAKQPFPILLALDIMTQIARGVCYLHGLNIAHRDLKPQNVVVTESRAAHLDDCICVKLVDFGMSKTKAQVSKSNTVSKPGVGTTEFRAPEVFPQVQRVAQRRVNWFKADAYSFAITCAVLLSLKKPFEGVLRSELYEELYKGVRPELPGDCPEDLVSLLKDCWAWNPQSRPDSQLVKNCKKFDVKPVLFPYEELRLATRDFHKDMKLGDSWLGEVYKGVLPNGNVVAVKKSSPRRIGKRLDGYLNEVVFFTGVVHMNLLTLKGCCLHALQWLRVYEYVENFNVHDILLVKGSRRQMVSWPVRFKICVGVAQGLHYLHTLAHPRIIHGNITARNVFLDRNFDPKIGGLSLAFLFPDDRSHISVTEFVLKEMPIAPEFWDGELTHKTDVYRFGILGLEIISGRREIDWTFPPDQTYLREWAWRLYKEDKLLELVDPTLHLTDVEVRDVQRAIKLCLMCIQDEAERRPSMARVVSILQV